MNLTYFGTNTLFIQKDTSSLMIDPHFSRPRFLKLLERIKPDAIKIHSGLRALGVDRLDGVILTHTHYDHALDASEVVCQAGGTLFGSESAVNLAKGAGVYKEKYRVVKPGDQTRIGTFKVTWLNSRHISFPPPLNWFMPEQGRIPEPITSPIYFWKYQSGPVYAILIDHLLVFGSAGFIPNNYKKYDVKVVVLSIGGLETKSFQYLERLYQQTVVQTGAQQVLLSHWDNFFRPISPGVQTLALGLANGTIRRLKQLGKDFGQRVKVLIPGEKISV
jgi:L-ascorbate metabolism protein UlaG (beta-lactamase superfamily)